MQPVVTMRNAFGFLIGLVVLGAVAGLLGGFRWLEFVAVGGTAAGTLGLAFYTYDLARVTRAGQEQTQELVRVGQDQVAAAKEQLEVSRAEVAAAEQTALEAARARIDADAPLLALLVHPDLMTLPGVVDDGEPRAMIGGRWAESELADLRVLAPVQFRLVNYGRSPALVSIPSLIPDLESLLAETGGLEDYGSSLSSRAAITRIYRTTT
jgi:hypothetical protein